jgi:hypothetical protein
MSSSAGLTLPFLKELQEVLENTGSKGGFTVPGNGVLVSFLVLMLLFTANASSQADYNWSFLFLTSPAWLPVLAGRVAVLRWLQYKRMEFLSEKKFVLLEMRIPRDTMKTPQAMETVLANLHFGPNESTWHKKYVVGGARPWWSFELVSIEGVIKFYIWTREDFRHAVETYMYAQYPNIEIIEAADYSRLIDPSRKPYKMAAYEFGHTEPDPYPIKTYVEYGLDKPPGKDEEKVNPLAQVLELLGSLKQGEQAWVQICVRVTKSEKFRGKRNKSGKPYTWKDEAYEKVEELRNKQTIVTGKDQRAPAPTEVQKDTIAAIERNVGKPGFDVGIRAIYLATEDKFFGSMGGYIANLWKPFSSSGLNGIKTMPGFSDMPDYPWFDPNGKKLSAAMHEAVHLYRRRAFFYPPYRSGWMVMSTEELATLYHVPSANVKTTSIPRIQSTTTAAPSNLPV